MQENREPRGAIVTLECPWKYEGAGSRVYSVQEMEDVAEILAQTLFAQISMHFCTFSNVSCRTCDWILVSGDVGGSGADLFQGSGV